MNALMEREGRALAALPPAPRPLREGATREEIEAFCRALADSTPDSVVGPEWLAAVLLEIPRPAPLDPVPHPYPVWRHLFLLTRWAKLRRMVTLLLCDTRDARYASGETRRLFREILARVDTLRDEWARAAWQDADVTALEEAAIAALYAMDADELSARAADLAATPMNDLLKELTGCR